jgi:hypothetical protein
MTPQAEIEGLLTDQTRGLGFLRRGSNWVRKGPDLYTVVNLQHSRWDDTLYINVGFHAAEDVEGEWLPESKCGVRFRIDALHGVAAGGLQMLSNSYVPPEGTALREALASGIVGPLAELIELASSLEGLKRALETMVSGRVMVSAKMTRRLTEVV